MILYRFRHTSQNGLACAKTGSKLDSQNPALSASSASISRQHIPWPRSHFRGLPGAYKSQEHREPSLSTSQQLSHEKGNLATCRKTFPAPYMNLPIPSIPAEMTLRDGLQDTLSLDELLPQPGSTARNKKQLRQNLPLSTHSRPSLQR